MVRNDTEVIRDHTIHLPQIQQEISQISTQLSLLIATLKSQVSPPGTTKEEIEESFVMQRFIDETCSYTELAYDEITSNMSARSESRRSESRETIAVGSYHDRNQKLILLDPKGPCNDDVELSWEAFAASGFDDVGGGALNPDLTDYSLRGPNSFSGDISETSSLELQQIDLPSLLAPISSSRHTAPETSTASPRSKNREDTAITSDSESDEESHMTSSSANDSICSTRTKQFGTRVGGVSTRKPLVAPEDGEYTLTGSKLQDSPKVDHKPAVRTASPIPYSHSTIPKSSSDTDSEGSRGRSPTPRPQWVSTFWNRSTSTSPSGETPVHLSSSSQVMLDRQETGLSTDTSTQADPSPQSYGPKHVSTPEPPRDPKKSTLVKRKRHQAVQFLDSVYDPNIRSVRPESESLLEERSPQESLNSLKEKRSGTSIRPRQSVTSGNPYGMHSRQVSHTSTVTFESENSDTWSNLTDDVSNTPRTSASETSFIEIPNENSDDPYPRRPPCKYSMRRSHQSYSGATVTRPQDPVDDLPALSSTENTEIQLLLSQAAVERSQGSKTSRKSIWSWAKSAVSDAQMLSNALIWAINDYDAEDSLPKQVPTERVVHYLINQGADPNAKTTSIYSYILGKTTKQVVPVLHIAIHAGLREVAKVLICKGAVLDARDWMQRTALHLAAENDLGDIIELLVSKGANIHADDWWCHSPLHVAATEGNLCAVKVLVKAGADPTIPGLLADVASIKISTPVLDFLLMKGADVNDVGKSKQTALYRAVENCCIENAHALLQSGAEESEALHLAENRKFWQVRGREERLADEELAKLLKSYAAGATVGRHRPSRGAIPLRSAMKS